MADTLSRLCETTSVPASGLGREYGNFTREHRGNRREQEGVGESRREQEGALNTVSNHVIPAVEIFNIHARLST